MLVTTVVQEILQEGAVEGASPDLCYVVQPFSGDEAGSSFSGSSNASFDVKEEGGSSPAGPDSSRSAQAADYLTHIKVEGVQQQVSGVDGVIQQSTDLLTSSSFVKPDADYSLAPVTYGPAFACRACSMPVLDSYMLEMDGCIWHEGCLRCCTCQLHLGEQGKCYVKNGAIYCRQHYMELFGAQCAKCHQKLTAVDWIRKAKGQVYHLACFSCEACGSQLSTGDEFGIRDDRLLCKAHYMESGDGHGSDSDTSANSDPCRRGPKRKRSRTTFSEEQRQILQASFEVDTNPSGSNLAALAERVGLSKRVTQVWFQNARARVRHGKAKRTS